MENNVQQIPTQTMQSKYITTDQYKQMVYGAKAQGLDPDKLAKTLVDNGYIVQGLNDQQMMYQQAAAGNMSNVPGSTDNPNTPLSSAQPTFQGQGVTGKIGAGIGNFFVGLVKGAGQSLNAIGTPISNWISKGLGATDQGIQHVQQQNDQQFTTHGLAEGLGAGTEHIAENIGLSMTGEGLAGELASKAGLAGKALTGAKALGFGLGGGLDTALTTNAPAGERISKGLGEAAINTAGYGLLGQLSKFSSAGDVKAYNAAVDTIMQQNALREATGKTLINEAKTLATKNPEAIVNLGKNLDNLKLVQKLSDIGLPDEAITKISGNMNPSDIQSVSSELNNLRNITRSPEGKDAIDAVNRQFRSWAKDALNNAKPGANVGKEVEKLFKNAKDVYEGAKLLPEVFNAEKPSKDAIDALLKYAQSQSKNPQLQYGLKKSIQAWAETSGLDLNNNVKLMQYTQTLKPALKTAFIGLLKYAGLPAIGIETAQHFTSP